MKRYNANSAAAFHLRHYTVKQVAYLFQFVVDFYSYSLKNTFCGMLLFAKCLCGHCAFYNIDKFKCRFNRLMFSVFDNCRSYGARVSFFTVFEEDSLHIFFWIGIHKRLRRKIVVPVHSHIKLCVSHIRESSFRGIELMRRNAEIHQQSVKHYFVFPQIFGQFCEVRV